VCNTRRTLFLLIVCFAAVADAQIQTINTTRSGGPADSGVFSFGPRVSNDSTDVRETVTPLKTGRQSAFGAVGDYRNGAFVLDFTYDHDPENGISIASLIVDTGNYSRDRGEVTVGFAATPFLDLQGGLRIDSARVGGIAVFNNPVSTDLNIDHHGLTAGIRFHRAAGRLDSTSASARARGPCSRHTSTTTSRRRTTECG
jgi:hypothetical protein